MNLGAVCSRDKVAWMPASFPVPDPRSSLSGYQATLPAFGFYSLVTNYSFSVAYQGWDGRRKTRREQTKEGELSV